MTRCWAAAMPRDVYNCDMPTYEYRCDSCTHQFEVFARMSDPDPEVCEACGSNTLNKILFPVAVHYKGSGFYTTDYAGKGKEDGTKDDSASSGEGGGESKDDGDSKADKGDSKKSDSSDGKKSKPADKKTKTASSSD